MYTIVMNLNNLWLWSSRLLLFWQTIDRWRDLNRCCSLPRRQEFRTPHKDDEKEVFERKVSLLFILALYLFIQHFTIIIFLLFMFLFNGYRIKTHILRTQKFQVRHSLKHQQNEIYQRNRQSLNFRQRFPKLREQSTSSSSNGDPWRASASIAPTARGARNHQMVAVQTFSFPRNSSSQCSA